MTEVNTHLPKGKKGLSLSDIIIILIILFLVAKFLGLTKAYLGVDPFGIEGENLVWVIMATGFGVLYKEGKDTGKRMDTYIERVAKLEVKVEKLDQPREHASFGGHA
jgi:hypothetical protein